MGAYPGQVRLIVSSLKSHGICITVKEHVHLISSCANSNRAVLRKSIKKGQHHVPPCPVVLLGLRTRIESVSIGPFSPDSYESRLQAQNHVTVLLEHRLELLDVPVHPLRLRIPRVTRLVHICLVGESEDTFHSSFAQDTHVL